MPHHVAANSLLEPFFEEEEEEKNSKLELNLFGSNIPKSDRKYIKKMLAETREEVREQWNANDWSPYYYEKGNAMKIPGVMIADIVDAHKPELAKAYETLFKARSSFMNVFGRKKDVDDYGNVSGKGGWSFPLINKVRGKMLANRYEKGLRKGEGGDYYSGVIPGSGIAKWLIDKLPGMGGGEGITAWSYPKHLQGEKQVMGTTKEGEQVPLITGAGGEFNNIMSTILNRGDADVFFATLGTLATTVDEDRDPNSPTYGEDVRRQMYDPQGLLTTIMHEGAHMQPIFGPSMHHGDPALTQQEWRKIFNRDNFNVFHDQDLTGKEMDMVYRNINKIIYGTLGKQIGGKDMEFPYGYEFSEEIWRKGESDKYYFIKGHKDSKGEQLYLSEQEVHNAGQDKISKIMAEKSHGFKGSRYRQLEYEKTNPRDEEEDEQELLKGW
tara:strand:+ start:65 stop:1381 length:1317 start_codon:yes stop_codon:yes gene_type:complete